jgi:DNA-3-methyladenine glycosylase II
MPADAAHGFLVAAAALVSPALRDAIAHQGPLWFPDREDRGLALQLARAIVGQQLSTKAARSIWARLEAAAADAGEPLAIFLRDDNWAALRACGISGGKVRALLGIAAADAAGRLDAAVVRAMEHGTRSAYLCDLRGIGQWTCDMVSIFYCHDEDVWPASDASVQRMFARLIGEQPAATAAQGFAPYRSILALHMWRLLDALP